MPRRGKQGDNRYISISARVPKDLRKAVKHRQIDEDVTLDDLLEHLLQLWVNGDVSLPEIDTPKPTPPKPKPSSGGDEDITELASICEQLGISGNELARRLDMASGTVSRYVSGKRDTPPEVLAAARALLDT